MTKIYDFTVSHLEEAFTEFEKEKLARLMLEEFLDDKKSLPVTPDWQLVNIQKEEIENEAFREFIVDIEKRLWRLIEEEKLKKKKFVVVYQNFDETIATKIVNASDWREAMEEARPDLSHPPQQYPEYNLETYKKYMLNQHNALVDVTEFPNT